MASVDSFCFRAGKAQRSRPSSSIASSSLSPSSSINSCKATAALMMRCLLRSGLQCHAGAQPLRGHAQALRGRARRAITRSQKVQLRLHHLGGSKLSPRAVRAASSFGQDAASIEAREACVAQRLGGVSWSCAGGRQLQQGAVASCCRKICAADSTPAPARKAHSKGGTCNFCPLTARQVPAWGFAFLGLDVVRLGPCLHDISKAKPAPRPEPACFESQIPLS